MNTVRNSHGKPVDIANKRKTGNAEISNGVKEQVFIDSDTILDLILRRKPFFEYSAKLFTKIEENEIEGFTSPVVFSNLFYILTKISNKKTSLSELKKLRILLKIVPINQKIIDLAFASEYEDFEDAIQYYSAVEHNIKYLITRNVDDYIKPRISVCSAEEYLKI